MWAAKPGSAQHPIYSHNCQYRGTFRKTSAPDGGDNTNALCPSHDCDLTSSERPVQQRRLQISANSSSRRQLLPSSATAHAEHLELTNRSLRLLAVCCHRLHQAKPRLLDILLRLVLGLGGSFVLSLQALQQLLQILVGLCRLILLLLDLGSQGLHWHGQELLDLLLRGGIAKVQVLWAAARAQILLGELGHCVKVTASRVLLHVVWVTILDGGEALNSAHVAQRLSCGCAVHVRNDDAGMALVLIHQLVPSGLHALAVASPRCLELDEDTLATCLCVPILGRQLRGSRRASEDGDRHQSPSERHGEPRSDD
mmetsp:Transcript_67808/g.109253  ORF Transcript_67808/g.109253 Transcript_67808/m.109253 type:complete len:312 (-) Transcript_67808:75-1010(-)